MYAKVDPKHWPLGLEEAEYLAKQLKRVAWDCEVVMERSVLAMTPEPVFRFAIIRWGRRADLLDTPKREVLWEGTDVVELTGMLRMLIAVEKDYAAADANFVRDAVSNVYGVDPF